MNMQEKVIKTFKAHPKKDPFFIEGSTVINHRIRERLKLTCEEYVFADFIKRFYDINNTRMTFLDVYKGTGIHPEAIIPLWESLKQKGIVYKHETGVVITTQKWDDSFIVKSSFEKFWELNKQGSKAFALTQYLKCLKLIDEDTIFNAYEKYVKHCNENGIYLKHASSWLNPRYKHWEDDLVEQVKKKKGTTEKEEPNVNYDFFNNK